MYYPSIHADCKIFPQNFKLIHIMPTTSLKFIKFIEILLLAMEWHWPEWTNCHSFSSILLTFMEFETSYRPFNKVNIDIDTWTDGLNLHRLLTGGISELFVLWPPHFFLNYKLSWHMSQVSAWGYWVAVVL